jgi:hypothetical protein
MEYKPISPIVTPTLQDVYLGSRTFSSPAPQLSFLEEVETVTASNLAAPDGTLITYQRSHVFYRLSSNPIKLRHLGFAVDLELYSDCYSFVQPAPAPKAEELLYPPANPFNYDWGADSYFSRTSSMYVFPGVPVPQKSSKVWDGRHNICVNEAREIIDSSDRIPKVQGEARSAISNPGMPKFTIPLANFSQTKKPGDYPPTLNQNQYQITLQRFLNENYNAIEIPDLPTTFLPLTLEPEGDVLETSLLNSQIAALLDGDYFVKWVAYLSTDTEGGS